MINFAIFFDKIFAPYFLKNSEHKKGEHDMIKADNLIRFVAGTKVRNNF